MEFPKVFCGPMSLNIVNAIIDYANEKNVVIGLLPSRRQVDYDGTGYVNGWNTTTFSEYVRSKTDKIIIERDHGGVSQGLVLDSGLSSFAVDAKYFDIIHIDPWKKHSHLYKGTDATIDCINYIYNKNPKVLFEVSTEEAIRKMNSWEIEYMLKKFKNKLSPEKFKNITYVVVQSGTGLYKNTNIGEYDEKRFLEMIDIAKEYNIKTKCHNGDYLSNHEYHKHFNLCLDAINVAPQLGMIESEILLGLFKKYELETLFNSCLVSGKW